MVPGLAPITRSPIACLPVYLNSIAAAATPTLARSYESAIYLLEIEAYTGIATTAYFPPSAITRSPIAAPPFGTAFSGKTTTLRLSDRGWIGEPTDADRANLRYDGRLSDIPGFQQDVPLLPEAASRGGRSFGDLPLDNLDGALDGWPALYAVSGRQAKAYWAAYDPYEAFPARGETGFYGFDRGPRFGDFSALYTATIEGWSTDETTLRIQLGGARTLTDAPAQPTAYAGTGGAEGDSSWTDVRMPGAYGRCRNVSPDLIDTANLVYRVHDRTVSAISDVRASGLSLTATSDYASYSLLAAASLSSGEYATCLAEGLFRLHDKLTDDVITCDVDGDVSAAGLWAETHAEIAQRLLRRIGVADSRIATASLAKWPAGTAHLWLPSHRSDSGGDSVADALDRLAKSVAGWWQEDRTGRVVLGRLMLPAFVDSVTTIDEKDVRGRIEEIAMSRPPRWRQRVGYRVNNTVQDRFRGSVAETDQNTWRQAYRETSDSDSDVQSRYPYAPEPALLASLFDQQADALALAQHVMSLHGPKSRNHRIPVGPLSAVLSCGDIVTVSYPRGGFGAGAAAYVNGVDDRTGAITVWWQP